MIGRTIGTYRIQSLLGQGGMGAVYRGVDLMLDRPVAIKALRADIAASPDHVERFRQEAKTLARLLDPHIATLYALLRDGDDLYMVMEFVEGETFEALLHRERRLPASRALDLFRQALRGIDHAHQRGIVHRDVKPANFMITPSGTVKVMDFGIARLLGTARMTQTAHAIGTAEYMAPEQVRAREVDARTDVYALGVLLYEMVAGRVPFDEPSAFEIMQAHLQREPTPPSHIAGDLPPAVESAILTALAKDPDDRFPTVAAFRDALPPLADAPPTASTPPVVKPTVAAPVQPEEPRTEDRGPLAEEASTDNAPAEEASPGVSEESPNLSRVASADEGPAGVSADGSVPATPPTSVPLAIADSVAEAGPSADTGRQPTEVLDLLRQTDEEEAPPALAADVIDDPEATVEIGRSAPPPTVVAPAGTPPTVAAR
ncbi:MAG: protein kinase, partial [Bacteroidota bacterium]